jgi:hypothetical protein
MLWVWAMTCESHVTGFFRDLRSAGAGLCVTVHPPPGGCYTAWLRTQSLGEHPGLSYLVFKGRRIDLPMFDPSNSLIIGDILQRKENS